MQTRSVSGSRYRRRGVHSTGASDSPLTLRHGLGRSSIATSGLPARTAALISCVGLLGGTKQHGVHPDRKKALMRTCEGHRTGWLNSDGVGEQG